MKILLTSLLCLASLFVLSQESSVSFEKWLNLKTTGAPQISPDGHVVVYPVTSTDWQNNTYDTELWMAKEGEAPVQLTRTPKGSSTMARFSPDNRFISFVADRGEKSQIYIIPVAGGEAMPVTKDEDGVGPYQWSHDGKWIAYLKPVADGKKEKSVKERYGAFSIEGEDSSRMQLWLLPFKYDSIVMAGQTPCYTAKNDSLRNKGKTDCVKLPVATKLTDGTFSISDFEWSPNDRYIAYTKVPDSRISSYIRSSVEIIDVATKRTIPLINNPTADAISVWSPDGKSVLISSNVDDSVSNYYTNAGYSF